MAQGRCRVDVLESQFWHTNTGVITDPDGHVVLVDPGVLPDELDRLATRIGEGRLLAALATHEDWDHVLWSSALGNTVPRLAHPDTARLLAEQRHALLNSLTQAERDLGVAWDHDLVGQVDPAPDTTVSIGDHIRVTFIPTPGHTDGHASLVMEGEGVLFAGDMLSDIDIPMLADSPGSLDAYLRSLNTLETLVNGARLIIPGHGSWCDTGEARRRLDRDRAYIEALEQGRADGSEADMPSPDDPRWQRAENRDAHRHNVTAAS